MSRIRLTDNVRDMLIKMSDGNPGALVAMMDIMKYNSIIDPQSAFSEISTILALDTAEFYGEKIYILYNDQCERDARSLIMLMRAKQLGILNYEKLESIANDSMRKIRLTVDEMNEIDNKVCEQLPEFITKEAWTAIKEDNSTQRE